MVDVDVEAGETVLDVYERNGWGDGLPLEAPTPERVDAMLRTLAPVNGRPVDPDEVIAVLPPRSGEATRRTIAINAVLAGCRPEHLPVLISAVRALAHPDLNLRGVNATTHPVAPLLIVHGQAAVDGGFNAGLGADVPATTFPPKEKLPGLFKSNPTAFIKESVRIDAPVTSATCVFKEDTEIDGINMSCCGKPGKLCVKAGTMHQYVLSMANRDPAVFDNPNTFDPARPNLDKMLGWNGALDDPSKYPRICPGQELSVAVIQTVISLVKEVADAQIV